MIGSLGILLHDILEAVGTVVVQELLALISWTVADKSELPPFNSHFQASHRLSHAVRWIESPSRQQIYYLVRPDVE
jgi:hypothetical protein